MRNDQSTFTDEYGYLVDQFDELEDIRYSDEQYLVEYQELKMKKNDGLPINQTRLDELEPMFKNKFPSSARWNKFQNALIGMQTFIKNEVEGFVVGKQGEMESFVTTKKGEVNNYIDTKQTEINAEIDNLKYRGTYNPSTQYFNKNTVDFDDGAGSQVYLCIQDSIGKNPTTSTHWKKLTIQGARGERGNDAVGLKFQGKYDASKTYLADDGVQFGGVLFASLVSGNVGNAPNLSLDTAYWAKALDVTVTVRKLIGVRNVATQTSNVNFMTGEIISFNPAIDSLDVYQNSVRITKGVDYNINPNNQSIDKIDDIWDGSTEQPIFFEFAVTKNILNDLVFTDGSAIQNGTIAKSKLTTDVQEEIDKIGILSGAGETKEKANKSDLVNLQTEVGSYKADMSQLIKIKKVVNILATNWVDDTLVSGFWKYEILDVDITANTVVDVNIHLADLEKASSIKSANLSSLGKVTLYADSEVTEDIVCDLKLIRQVSE